MNKNFIIQFCKYGIVGVLNTLVTAVVIWIMMRFVFGITNDLEASTWEISASNLIGYIAGLINSFVWNRNWTFKSKNKWKKEFLVFTVVFLICYIPQLLLVNVLNTYTEFPAIKINLFSYHLLINHAYICQLIGMVFYTLVNFVCNKYYTFKK